MSKMNFISGNKPPRVAVTVTDQETNEQLKPLDVDALEVRVDRFKSQNLDDVMEHIRRLKQLRVPLILTVRNDRAEGGTRRISDEKKARIFEAAILLVDAIDIELSPGIRSAMIELGKKQKRTVIVSAHNFKITPSERELEKIFKDSRNAGADIVKIAAKANSLDDVNRMLQFTMRHREDRVITISLGDLGSISRLLFPGLGSLLVYTYIDRSAAPGQIPLDVLQDHLRWYYPQYHRIKKTQ